jgi:L-2-hydroxycarboxylate dehydrogenase (NAD+)
MYTYDYLLNFSKSVFMKMGCSEEDALAATRVFLAAELRGLPSHGMLRIKDYYQLWKSNRINTKPRIMIVHESPSTAVVDGDNAIGMVASVFSMNVAIEKAKKSGTGWVSTRNSNHFGMGAYYIMMALEHDMIGICMTNANPLVAPPSATKPLLGTNPIAVAIPAQKQPPFIADFSTTAISRGKLVVAAKKGEKVAFGYVQDKFGNPSDDPEIIEKGGAMLPLGGDLAHGSHKGYCLGAIVDIFSAVLSGANFGPFVPPSVAFLPVLKEKVGEGTGHFFGAMRIDAFQPPDEFKAGMDRWIETFRNADHADGKPGVMIPGDMERMKEIEIKRSGINIIPKVSKEMKEIADELGIEFEIN